MKAQDVVKRRVFAWVLGVVVLAIGTACGGEVEVVSLLDPPPELPYVDEPVVDEPVVDEPVVDEPVVLVPNSTSAGGTPSLEILAPVDNEVMPTAFTIHTKAKNLELAPVGTLRDGEGHLHVIINEGCAPPGDLIPHDDGHRQYGHGLADLDIELPPGEYDLCVQASDGFHVALGISDTVSITVVGSASGESHSDESHSDDMRSDESHSDDMHDH